MYEITILRPSSTQCHMNVLKRLYVIPFGVSLLSLSPGAPLTASSKLPCPSRKLSCIHMCFCIRRRGKRAWREWKKMWRARWVFELRVRDVRRRDGWLCSKETALALSSGSSSGFARKTLNKIWLSAKYASKLLPPKVAVPRIYFTTWNEECLKHRMSTSPPTPQ